MILVAGATGHLGIEVCRRLQTQGKAMRALVRATSDPDKVAELRGLGAEIAIGDLRDRESLDNACRGATAVISSASTVASQVGGTISTVDLEGQLSLVEAAQEAGVQQFVFVSFSGNMGSDSPLNRAKRQVEHRLIESGMTYTILRPSFFMEYFLTPLIGFDYPHHRATIYGSGENKISWIALGDVAESMTRSIDNPRAANAIVELGGPESLSPLEVVRLFESVMGEKFEVQIVPQEALQAQKDGAPDALPESLSALLLDYAHGDPVDAAQARSVYPFEFTSVRAYAERCRDVA